MLIGEIAKAVDVEAVVPFGFLGWAHFLPLVLYLFLALYLRQWCLHPLKVSFHGSSLFLLVHQKRIAWFRLGRIFRFNCLDCGRDLHFRWLIHLLKFFQSIRRIRLVAGLDQNFSNCHSLLVDIEILFDSMTIIVKHGEMKCFRAYLQFLSIKVAKHSKSDCALHELDICNLEL